jgi:Domain of unknown function (DUF4160)
MPEICRFYGIVIQVYYGDHPPAHFHAVYGEYVAKIAIESLQIIEGFIPARAQSLVREWAKLHEQELRDAFDLAANFQQPGKIAPLP